MKDVIEGTEKQGAIQLEVSIWLRKEGNEKSMCVGPTQ